MVCEDKLEFVREFGKLGVFSVSSRVVKSCWCRSIGKVVVFVFGGGFGFVIVFSN